MTGPMTPTNNVNPWPKREAASLSDWLTLIEEASGELPNGSYRRSEDGYWTIHPLRKKLTRRDRVKAALTEVVHVLEGIGLWSALLVIAMEIGVGLVSRLPDGAGGKTTTLAFLCPLAFILLLYGGCKAIQAYRKD